MVISLPIKQKISFLFIKNQLLAFFCSATIVLTVFYLGESHRELVPILRRILRYFFDIAVFMAPQLVEYYVLRALIIGTFILTSIAAVTTVFTPKSAFASTGINQTVNFQGKVVNSDGTNVVDGLYTFVFKLYDASSGGSNPWTETQNNVQVTAGIFRVSLGSVTPFSGVDFNTDNLYLGINFNSDGEMTPRIRFAAVPYAFNAQKVSGLTVSDTTGTLTIPNSKIIQFGGGFTTDSNDINLATTGSTSITLPTTGTIATLAGAENLSNKTFLTSLVISGVATDLTTGTDETLTITPNGIGNVLINPQAGGQAALVVDKNGIGDIFSASGSGVTVFTIKNDGALYGPNWAIQASGSAKMTSWEGGGLSSDCSADGQKVVWNSDTKQFDCKFDQIAETSMGADARLGTADLGNITLANSTTYLNTVSITPTTSTADVLVDAYLWTRSLSNTDQTITLEIRDDSTPNCTGNLLASSASSLVSANGANGPSVFASYVVTNPGTSTKSYDICAYSTTNNGAAAGGLAKAVAIDSGTSNSQSNWTFDQNGLITPIINSLDLALGGNSTESSKFAVVGIAGSNTPVASISAQNVSGQALVLGGSGTIETTRKNSLFIGSGTSGDVILGQSGNSVVLPGLNCSSLNNSGKITTTSNGTLVCGDDISGGGGSGSSNWVLSENYGTIYPINSTLDLFVGGVATDDARFAFFNVSSGTPTASISAITGNSLSLNADGILRTSNAQSLTLGGGDSGEVYIQSPLHIDDTMGVFGGGLSDCNSPTTAKLLWSASTNRFSCGTDQGGGGGSSITVRETDSSPAVSAVAVVEFGPASTSSDEFIITDEGSNVARVRIGNQVGMLNQNESATGIWNFSAGLSIDGGIGTNTSNQDLVLSSNGSGNIIFNSDGDTYIGIGTSYPHATLDILGSGGTNPVASISGSTSNTLLAINNEGLGDLFTASSSGYTRFRIENDGTASISATTGSTYVSATGLIATTAKQNLQLGDQKTGNIQIGTGGSTTPNLLVLDTKNDNSSDPSGVDGAMYYNSSLGAFRCYKSGGWQNCGADVNKQQYAKSADQSVTNSTTLTDETALQVTMGAGETWIFQYFILASNNNSATPDWKAAILAPTASACDVTQSGAETAGAAFPQATTTDCTTPGTLVDSAINAGAAPFQVYIQGAVTDNGSGGTIKLQFAENTAGLGTSLTIKKGSYVVAYKATGADLAEVYYTKDYDIQPGNVVSLDPSSSGLVKKSSGVHDKNVLGIVSTQPGLVIGDGSSNLGKPVFLALSGRVPVRVSTESGQINAGDYLTASSIPGIAMKAVNPGRSIGQALTSATDDGVVTAFINNGYFSPQENTVNLLDSINGLSYSNVISSQSSELSKQILGLSNRVNTLETQIDGFNKLSFNNNSYNSTESANFEAGLTSFGPVTFGQLALTDSLSINSLSLTENGINNLGLLEIQPFAQGDISFLNKKIVFDTAGNIQVAGTASFQKDVTVNGEIKAHAFATDYQQVTYESDSLAVSSASAGVITVLEGKPLTLKDLLIGKNTLLYLTPRTEIDAPIYISSQSAGMATFSIGKSTQKKVEVNFLIVNLRN